MSNYKLVPVEPTAAMESEGMLSLCGSIGGYESGLVQKCWHAMLAAAPAVQGEPTDAELLAFAGEENFFLFCDGDDFLQIARAVMHRYMGRKTAVQGEPVATIHVDGSFIHVAWRIPAPSRCAMDVYTAPQPADQQPDVTHLVEAAAAALDEIEKIMYEAYNSAGPVCCGREGSECCGSPEPEWSEFDQNTMDRLDPHQRALTAALAAYRKGGGQ